MSDVYQIKTGQRGKVLRFITAPTSSGGSVLTAATAVNVRVRRESGLMDIYPAVKNAFDPFAADLTTTTGMFDTEETVNVDMQIISPGKVNILDFNITVVVVAL